MRSSIDARTKDKDPNNKPLTTLTTSSLNECLIDNYHPPLLHQNKLPDKLINSKNAVLDQSILLTFHVKDKNKHPIKNRSIDDYVKHSKNPTLSFHSVDKVSKKHPKKKHNPIRFFKHNPCHSLMSELEAVCCAFFRLIAPRHAPTARAHYDKDNIYVGLSSKGVPGFKSTKEDPLKEENLKIDALDKGYFTIPELDEIDARVAQDGYILDNMADDQIIFEKCIDNDKKNKTYVTVKDLKNYRMIKGQAIGLTASYVLGEDDCHRGNISKYGIRIDFDMTLWWILCKFKESGIVDWTFRFPNESTFIIHPYDILHFPNLVHADPFYWPTKPPKILKEPLRSFVGKMLPVSENAYEVHDNSVFQKLETHPVFVYHKYATLLKFILTNHEMYRAVAKLYLRENITMEDKNLIDVLSQHIDKRIQLFKKVLLQMPDFYAFLNTIDKNVGEKYGDIILDDIKSEFEQRNQKYMNKKDNVSEYKEQVISIDIFQKEYESFMSDAKNIHDKSQMQIEAEFSIIDDENEIPLPDDKKQVFENKK